MKSNRSLAISNRIQEFRTGDILGVLSEEFPNEILNSTTGKQKTRDRVFTVGNTLLTMVLTSVQQDKTLKNSVGLYHTFHQKRRQQVMEEQQQKLSQEKERDRAKGRKAGRPKGYAVRLPKSLEKDISLSTAAYSKARGRVPLSLTQELFTCGRIEQASNNYTHWHGHRVMVADGTYLQMQDTESIRKEYEVKCQGEGSEGYPQALLEVITERGTGQIYDFKISDRHTSELPLCHAMIDDLPENSLLLADDLYNCYETIAKCCRKGVKLLVPAKRKRNHEVVEVLGDGDEIIRIKAPAVRSKWAEDPEPVKTIDLRQIRCKSPDGKEYILHTTVTDSAISKEEIQLLYLTRWDIEIGIREVKTIMDINILRSKTPDMALKELTVSLATYNLIRKMIYASIKDLPFSPKEDLIQEFYTFNTDILVDKKGRVYNRWSTGRRRTSADHSYSDTTEAKTG